MLVTKMIISLTLQSGTDSLTWSSAKEPYPLSWHFKLEPVLALPTELATESRFLGFGWSHGLLATDLKRKGFDFIALSDVFVTHVSGLPKLSLGKMWVYDHYQK